MLWLPGCIKMQLSIQDNIVMLYCKDCIEYSVTYATEILFSVEENEFVMVHFITNFVYISNGMPMISIHTYVKLLTN